MPKKGSKRSTLSGAVTAKQFVSVFYEPPLSLKKFVSKGDIKQTILVPVQSETPVDVMLELHKDSNTGDTKATVSISGILFADFEVKYDGSLVDHRAG